jgi:mRNA interferase MazF
VTGTAVRRGDLVTVAAPGDYGKPRPALVVQSDLFDQLPSVTLCLITSELRDTPIFRITLDPSPANGLQRISQIQIDKMMTVARERVGGVIGRLDDATLLKVNRSLAVFVGIA